MIETTANIDAKTYMILRESAKELNADMQDIVHILFKLMLAERPMIMKNFKRIKYQDRIEGRVWKKLHLSLNEGSYEGCLDLRKLCKMSVSYLLEVAVGLYLERAKAELRGRGSTDNYPEIYVILTTHTPELSTYTAFHTFPPVEILNFFLDRFPKT